MYEVEDGKGFAIYITSLTVWLKNTKIFSG